MHLQTGKEREISNARATIAATAASAACRVANIDRILSPASVCAPPTYSAACSADTAAARATFFAVKIAVAVDVLEVLPQLVVIHERPQQQREFGLGDEPRALRRRVLR